MTTSIPQLDPIIRKKLVLVKQIYQRALVSAEATHSAVDRLLSVIGFDLANETALKTVVSAFKPNDKTEKVFQGVIDQAEAILIKVGKDLPLKNQILHVHDFRNDAQHKGKYPSPSDVSDCRAYTRDFLKELCVKTWGADFEKINLAGSIKNEKVKQLLGEAEVSFSEGDYATSVAKAAAAFQVALSGLADALTNELDYWNRAFFVARTSGHPEMDHGAYDAFLRVRDFVVFQVLGVNLQEYLRYKFLTRNVDPRFAMSGELYLNIKGPAPNELETEFVISFVSNTAILIESLDDEIKVPYRRW